MLWLLPKLLSHIQNCQAPSTQQPKRVCKLHFHDT
jgi:hypothetical protein